MDFLKAIYEYVSGHRPVTEPEGERVQLNLADRRLATWAAPWAFCADPFDIGLRKAWFNGPSRDGEGRALPDDFSFGGWQTHDLPTNWNLADAAYAHYEGAAWFSRTVEVAPVAAGERRLLVFQGVNYRADVWVNGRYLGHHEGGHTPFTFDATPFLTPSSDVLIRVDNVRMPDRVPGLNFDWFNYGGIYRGFGLVTVPEAFIRDFHLRLDPAAPHGLLVDVWVSGPGDSVRLTIPEAGYDWTLPVGADGHASARLPAVLDRWSPQSPRRYRCTLAFGVDEVSDEVGFRTIRADMGRLLLNDEPLTIRGICLHEEVFGRGRVVREADMRQAFAHARELGCNLVRLAHYPHGPGVARWADEEGMLLWEEIPVYWNLDFENRETLAGAAAQLEELITRDRNRASVVLWALANETPVHAARNEFMVRLAGRARALDDARPLAAACVIRHDGQGLRLDDPLVDVVDVVGVNEYFGWYDRGYERLDDVLRSAPRGKPLVISEVGAGAEPGFHGPPDTLFTEECQAEVYRRQFEILDRHPNVIGTCFWVLYDFASPGRQNAHQRGFNRKGVIAEDRSHKKLAFGVLRAHYRAGSLQAAAESPERESAAG